MLTRSNKDERRDARKDDKADSSGRKRSPIPYLVALLVIELLIYAFVLHLVSPSAPGRELSLDRFYGALRAGKVKEVTILDADSRVAGTLDGRAYWTALPRGELAVNSLAGTLANNQIRTNVDQQVYKGILNAVAQFLLPVLLFATLFGLLFVLFVGAAGIGGLALFGRSGARRYRHDGARVTFADVAGQTEAVNELREVVEFLKSPERFSSLGARAPKGVLLLGPPGCGKTLLARAVAGEADVPFFSVSGSEFVEMLVGVGASRVRDLFEQARRIAPAIIFIDELDAVGRARSSGPISHEERDQTVNEMLVQMDGFGPEDRVVVITATNRADILDEALTRPGRFDRRVVVDQPDLQGRQAVLAVHLRGKQLGADVDATAIARRTPGFSGADLANVVNEAALLAARNGRSEIGQTELDEGIERALSGAERRSRILSPREKRLVAFHEAGHALVAWSLPAADPLEKVSIVSRGASLGHTRTVAAEDRFIMTRGDLEARLAVLMAGREAELAVFGEPSSASAEDLSSATSLARQMVTEWGMSADLAPLVYRPGDRFARASEAPDALTLDLDGAVARVVNTAADSASRIIAERREWLDRLAQLLEEQETLLRPQLETLFASLAPSPVAATSGGT